MKSTFSALKKGAFFLLLFFLIQYASSQSFKDVTDSVAAEVIPTFNSDIQWGDYDDDNDLDLIIIGQNEFGQSITQIYRNDQDSNQIKLVLVQNITLNDIENGFCQWGDYNRDGYLDIIISGEGNSTQFTYIYQNDQNGNFHSPVSLPNFAQGEADWGDYDNDGDLDLLMNGASSDFPQGRTQVYKNLGNDEFIPLEKSLFKGIQMGANEWADLDGDRDLDFIVVGTDTSGQNGQLYIYENRGNDVFQEISHTISSLTFPSLSLGDFNDDGKLDILMTGKQGGPEATLLYQNIGNFQFTLSNPQQLQNLLYGSGLFGDFNNDNLNDILLTGYHEDSAATFTKLYTQDNQGQFQLQADLELIGIRDGLASWIDYDNDGDIDLALSGNNTSLEKTFKLYRNNIDSAILSPPPPTHLKDSVKPGEVTFSWSAPAEASNGWTYNIYIRPKDIDSIFVVSPMADIQTGFRKIVAKGNVQTNTSWTIHLPDGEYVWAVQSINLAYQGSEFANGGIFEVNSPFEDVTELVAREVLGTYIGSMHWGDYDNDNDLDLIVSGIDELDGTSIRLYKNENGTLQLDPNPLLSGGEIPGTFWGFSRWGDFNRDGYLDLLISGDTGSGNITELYENNGAGKFLFSRDFQSFTVTDGKWGDFDNDGDIDFMITGLDTGIPLDRTLLYENKNGGRFSIFSEESFKGIERGDIQWGDIDNDSDLDLIINGFDTLGDATFSIYKNNENTFQSINNNVPPIGNSTLDIGDVNNDKRLDFLITGEPLFGSGTISGLFTQNESGSFEEVLSSGLRNIKYGALLFGDYNNDGLSDIFLNGYGGATYTEIYKQLLNGQFERQDSFQLKGASDAGASWVDFNNDGRLDIAVNGAKISSDVSTLDFRLYLNKIAPLPSTISPPRNLTALPISSQVTLNWQVPPEANDGWTYNLFIVPEMSADTFFVAPNSDTTSGYRRLVEMGNAQTNLTWTYKNLKPGKYYWSVQAIDNSFRGSAFAETKSFEITNDPTFDVITSTDFRDTMNLANNESTASIQVSPLLSIESVKVHLQSLAICSWEETNATQNDSITYSIDLNSLPVDPIGYQYSFEVIYNGNNSESSDTAQAFYFIQDQDERIPLDPFDIKFNIFKNNRREYQIISIPFDLNNSAFEDILRPFGSRGRQSWRLFHFENNGLQECCNEIMNFERGRSYWFAAKQREDNIEVFTGEGTTGTFTCENPFQMVLQPGWNQIATPYNITLEWDRILCHNGINVEVEDQLRVFTGNNDPWADANNLIPFEGAMVCVTANNPITLEIPPNLGPCRVANDNIFNSIDESEWEVKLSLVNEDIRNDLSGFGMRTDADSSWDRFDRISPPDFTTVFGISFPHPDYRFPSFVKDITSSQKKFIWNFEVNTELKGEYIKLEWENDYFQNSLRDLVLFDVLNQRQISMKEFSSYSFKVSSESHAFRVYYGDQAIQPDFAHLGDAYPNPTDGFTTIPFSLPQTQDLYKVKVLMFDLQGKLVAEIANGEYKGGFHQIEFAVQNQDLSPGTYFYQLIVNGQAIGFKKLQINE